MTTRRRPSAANDDAQLPGTKDWRDRVQKLKQELDANGGRRRQTLERADAAKAEERQALTAQAETLQIAALLGYLNATVLNGEGVIETRFYWDADFGLDDDWEYDDDDGDDDDWDDDGDEDEDDDGDEDDEEFVEVAVLSTALSWKAAAQVRVEVELLRQEDNFVLRIGDAENRTTPRNAQAGIFNAFKEALALEDDDE